MKTFGFILSVLGFILLVTAAIVVGLSAWTWISGLLGADTVSVRSRVGGTTTTSAGSGTALIGLMFSGALAAVGGLLAWVGRVLERRGGRAR